MITTGEDDMLVPDFWPEIIPTPEDSIFAYTTPKESYIRALKNIMQSSALGIPIRCVYHCSAWLLVLLCGVILEKDFTVLEMASVAFRDGKTSRGTIIEALKKAEVSL